MRRIVSAVVLVLSASLAALLPLADAYAERAAGTPRAHVEQPGSTRCPPVHDYFACQLCRILRLGSNDTAPALALVQSAAALSAPVVPVVAAPWSRRIPGASPRAPPIA